MANVLRDKIASLAKEVNNDYMRSVKATIVYYDNKTNFAICEAFNPKGAGKLVFPRVPIQITPGSHTPGPFEGDEVWIEFDGGNLNLPKVVAFADRSYMTKTREQSLKHPRSGAYVAERNSKRPGMIKKKEYENYSSTFKKENEKPGIGR